MMRITVITETNTVGIDGEFYNKLDLSSCNIPSNIWALQWNGSAGHIEFNTTIPNEDITSLPDWVAPCLVVWEAKNNEIKNPPAPTPEQLMAEHKADAEMRLIESDWSMLPDVPLKNKPEWEVYRAALREIVSYPTVDPIWPTKPQVVW